MQSGRMHGLGSRRRAPRLPRRCAGQSVVEFSLISVVLLAMTFGIVDFGRVWLSLPTDDPFGCLDRHK